MARAGHLREVPQSVRKVTTSRTYDLKSLDTPERVRLTALDPDFPVFERRIERQKERQNLLSFGTGKRCAGTEVRPMTERKMTGRRPLEIETIGVDKN